MVEKMKRNPWTVPWDITTNLRFLEDHIPGEYRRIMEKIENAKKLKFGRLCYTCRFRESKFKSSFIKCRYRSKHQPIWEKAKCNAWRPTRDPRRLSQYERFVETKNLLRNPDVFNWYYFKYTSEVAMDRPPIHLGRSCFVCIHRGKKKRNMVFCKDKRKYVWEKAACRAFRLVKDYRLLDQYRKYMVKSGVDVSTTDWIYYKNRPEKYDKSDAYFDDRYDDSDFYEDEWGLSEPDE